MGTITPTCTTTSVTSAWFYVYNILGGRGGGGGIQNGRTFTKYYFQCIYMLKV